MADKTVAIWISLKPNLTYSNTLFLSNTQTKTQRRGRSSKYNVWEAEVCELFCFTDENRYKIKTHKAEAEIKADFYISSQATHFVSSQIWDNSDDIIFRWSFYVRHPGVPRAGGTDRETQLSTVILLNKIKA